MTLPRTIFNLDGQVALVSGGSRGLGFQISLALATYGAKVVMIARRADQLEAAVDAIAREGSVAVGVVGDIGDGCAEELVRAVMSDHGRLDILVNCAGTTWGSPAEDHSVDAWNKVLNVNLTGLFQLTQAAARQAFLPARSGSVINVASIEGLQGHHPDRPGTVAYNASKGAVINMSRALAAEWGPRNVRVNVLAPGYFPSRMTAQTIEDHGAEILAGTPLGRLGGDQDLMGPVLLLASDAGRHITGQVIVVDGGATII